MPHIHEKIDYTASVYIVNDGAVFLHFHEKTQLWLPVGGHIELDEDPNEAAVREAKEESGLDIELVGDRSYFRVDDRERDLLPPRFMNRHRFRFNESHEHVDLVYFGRSKDRNVKVENNAEHRWFAKEDLETAELLPQVKFYAQAALNEVK